MDIISEEKTTLPDGATLSVIRTKFGDSPNISTYLIAAHKRNEVKMKVDDISPNSLRQYLDMMVREIRREQGKLEEQPESAFRSPKTIPQFVYNMACAEMFVVVKH